MVRRSHQRISVLLKLFWLGYSLPLLLTSPAWAQECTQTQIKGYIARFNDSDTLVSQSALSAVIVCGSKSVTALSEALKQDKSDNIRSGAASALGSIGTPAKGAVPQLIETLKQDQVASVRRSAADALWQIKESAKEAVPQLIETLNQDQVASVRSSAAYALGNIGKPAKEAVPHLMETLKQDRVSSVRISAAYALGLIGESAKEAVPQLIETLKQDRVASVRSYAAAALGNIGEPSKAVISQLIKTLKQDKDIAVRRSAADALGQIGLSLQKNKSQLSSAELGNFIKELENALKVLDAERNNFTDKQIADIRVYFEALKQEKQSRWHDQMIKRGGIIWLAHALTWVTLIFIYPKSRQVQAIFFWTPWMRKFFGLGYVGLVLTWIPFLRSKLFAPFRESLLSDADLERFDPQAYFANSEVKRKGSTDIKPVREAISEIQGQIVLEGESGLGKTMFLRQLVYLSRRIVVYLPAKKCSQGVMEAIQLKLHGLAKDPAFLQSLIYSGAIDICIDGLNEVTPDTRAKITNFVESYFKGNIIMATQPLEWIAPSTADTYILQPLKREQIEEFLISRQAILPKDAPISGLDYKQACKTYLATALNAQQSEEELVAVRRMLSNPMELTVVAQMLASGKKPDLLNLQQQQYEKMAEDYERVHLAKFPLAAFAEAVYQMRLNDEDNIPTDKWRDELECMERYKMVLCRQFVTDEGKVTKEWCFRHDKIQEFFIVQTFLGENNYRPNKHISDSRFRGVYFLLATLLPLDAAMQLRENLIRYAAKTKDHTVSDMFIQLLLSRQAL